MPKKISAWNVLVKKNMKKHKGKSFAAILKISKAEYRKKK